jgi:integrase
MAKLTATSLARLRPTGKRYEVADGTVPGLCARVGETGKITFVLHSWIGGKHVRETLGPIERFKDLAAVRKRAQEVKELLAKGTSPAAEKRAAAAQSLESAVELFIEKHVRVKTKARTAKETERILRRYVLPAWKGRAVSEIARADVARLIETVAEENGSTQAQRVLAAVRKLYNWALLRSEYASTLAASPVPKGLASSAKPRDRVLSLPELRLLLRAVDGLAQPWLSYARMLVYCGQRRSETASARWQDFDLKARLWRLPAEVTKNGKPHEVPLPDAAVAALESLPRIGDFVFTTTGDVPISGQQKIKERLDAAIRELVKQEKAEGLFSRDWTWHDLRRSLASHLAEAGVREEVVGAILNHQPKTITGRVYVHAALRPEKASALRLFEQLVLHAPSNVLPFRAAVQ